MLISLLCLTAGFVSCVEEDSDYVYPSLLDEFVDVCTDESGMFTHLQTDWGDRLSIVNSSEIKADGVVPDTVYRTISRYELVEGGAKLYSLQAIPSLYPELLSAFPDGVEDDPLEMQSIWRGGKYLNMILLVKTQGGKHHFRIVKDSLIRSVSGVRTLYLRLSHDAADDVEAYTSKTFLSVPLDDAHLTVSDSVKIDIPTVQGWQQWGR